MNHVYVLMFRDKGIPKALRADGTEEVMSESALSRLERMTLLNGSTLRGRTDAVRQLTGWKQKLPVVISERTQEIWFPLISPEDPECIWVCSGHIIKASETAPGCTEILFSSGYRTTVNAGVRTVRKQMERCRTLRDLLNENAEKNKPAGLLD